MPTGLLGQRSSGSSALARSLAALVCALVALAAPRLARAAMLCEAPVLRTMAEAEVPLDELGGSCPAPATTPDPLGPEAGECGADGASRVGRAAPRPLDERAWVGAKCDGLPTVDGGCVVIDRGVAHVSSGGEHPPDPPVLDRDGALAALVPVFHVSFAPALPRELQDPVVTGRPLSGARRGVERPPRA